MDEELEIIDIESAPSTSSDSSAPSKNVAAESKQKSEESGVVSAQSSGSVSNQVKSPVTATTEKNSILGTRLRGDMNFLMQQAARLGLTSSTDRFMQNFNPENSNRERRKLTRNLSQTYGKKEECPIQRNQSKRCYDSKGILIINHKDLCDCLNEKCPGCFFPCPKCRSCKCGHECRQFRKWAYESAEAQAAKRTIHNPYKHLLKKKP